MAYYNYLDKQSKWMSELVLAFVKSVFFSGAVEEHQIWVGNQLSKAVIWSFFLTWFVEKKSRGFFGTLEDHVKKKLKRKALGMPV